MEYVGKRIAKLDAADKASGKSRFIQDFTLPGILVGKILRSPVASAKIVSLDVSHTKGIAGVKAVLTGTDNPRLTFGFGNDRLPLQSEFVSCVGDEIAAVAAVDEETAIDAIGAIQFNLEKMPALFDPRQSVGSKVLVHRERGSNLFKEHNYSHGEIDFGRCAFTVEGAYKFPYQAHCCLSPSGVAADWSASGALTLYTPTQVPFLIQRDLASALGISPTNVRIIQPTIGGGFGSRLDLYPYEVICALLSRATARPVKILFDRNEEFSMDPFRPQTYLTMKTGVDKTGRIIACDVDVTVDCGAYISWGSMTPVVMMHTIGCMYNIEAVKYRARTVYTNNPHTGAFRGFGNPELLFALETQVDRLAEKLGIDAVDIRLRNANKAGETTPQGSKITSCAFSECIQEAAKRIQRGTASKPHLKRGVGLAAIFHVGGGARIYRSDGCGALVHLDDFGRVTVMIGSTDIGQGAETVVAQIVAEELCVPLESVVVQNSDTQSRLWDVGVHASRTTFIGGNAARLAAHDAKRQILEAAAGMLSCKSDDLAIQGGKVFVKNTPAKSIAYDKILRSEHFKKGGSVVIGKAYYDPPSSMVDEENKGNISAAYTFAAQAVEVEVDTETGQVRVLKVVSAHDVGRAINPMYVEGQIEGGVMQGIGYALTEEALVHEGKVLNPNFLDYRMPGPCDMPEIECVIVESIDAEGPYGAKGIGEPPIVGIAPAIANAIYNAVGVRLNELPMTPERLLRTLRGQNT